MYFRWQKFQSLQNIYQISRTLKQNENNSWQAHLINVQDSSMIAITAQERIYTTSTIHSKNVRLKPNFKRLSLKKIPKLIFEPDNNIQTSSFNYSTLSLSQRGTHQKPIKKIELKYFHKNSRALDDKNGLKKKAKRTNSPNLQTYLWAKF